MKIDFYENLYIFAILFVILISISTTLKYSEPTAEDWNRHVVWIQRLIKGDFTTIQEYPPLFHLLMIIPVYLFLPHIKYLQILFSFLSIFSISYFAYKVEGKKAITLTTFLLSSSLAFLMYSMALTPQILDYILFPLIILLYFKDKYILTSLGLIALFYNHLFGIVFFMVILVYSLLWKRDFLKYTLLVLILSIPIIYIFYIPAFYNAIYLPLFFNKGTIVGINVTNYFAQARQVWQNAWDRQYSYPIEIFLLSSGSLMWLLFPLTIYLMKRQREFSRYQLFYIIWMTCFVPVCLIFNLWRGMSYFIIPLSLFEVSVMAKSLNTNEITESFIKHFGDEK